jgi:hypothetical protein
MFHAAAPVFDTTQRKKIFINNIPVEEGSQIIGELSSEPRDISIDINRARV